jgi:hypothetical protein
VIEQFDIIVDNNVRHAATPALLNLAATNSLHIKEERKYGEGAWF